MYLQMETNDMATTGSVRFVLLFEFYTKNLVKKASVEKNIDERIKIGFSIPLPLYHFVPVYTYNLFCLYSSVISLPTSMAPFFLFRRMKFHRVTKIYSSLQEPEFHLLIFHVYLPDLFG